MTVLLLTLVVVLSIFTLLFGRVLKEFKVNDDIKIVVTTGGLLSCGELIKISKLEFGIFDKIIYHENGLCLQGIENIEIRKFNKNNAEFLIYHNEKMDSENPYKYELKNKNVW